MSVDLSLLNPQQRLAVETTEGPLLVLAGAGTGKTRVITYRIAHLVARGVEPSSILAVTFTNKAAREMRDRVGQLVGRGAARAMVVSTFHSFCARVLREDIECLGYKRNFSICDAGDQLTTLRAALKEVVLPGQRLDPKLTLFKIGRAKNDMLSPKQLEGRAEDDLDLAAARIYARYQDALKASNAVDFDDLLLLAAKLFQDYKDVLAKYQKRFMYVLVDEYQDTNQTQYLLLRALTSAHRNLCVVGDDDQSIYGWRGAHVGNILNFERDFPGAQCVYLEQNYRSTSVILEAANAVAAGNARRKEKRLWTANGKGQLIECIEAADDREEADEVVRRIAQAAASKGGKPEDCAVLYRTNAQSRTFEEKLRLRRIPYSVVGGLRYYDRREIRDVVAYFKAVVNPEDDVALRRIINMPARGISRTTVNRLSDLSVVHKCSLQEALARSEEIEALPAKAQAACTEFAALLARYRDAFATTSLADTGRSLFEEIGYEDALTRAYDDRAEAMGRIENVREIVSALAEYEKRDATRTLQDYLDDVATRDEDQDDDDDSRRGAKLMSLHSAKGLEFPLVFLVGAEEGLLPHRKSETDDQDTIDEERRLFYVGITRAQKHLVITHVAERMKFGRPTKPVPSRFLEEIPQQFLRRQSTASREPAEEDSRQEHLATIRRMLEQGDDLDERTPGSDLRVRPGKRSGHGRGTGKSPRAQRPARQAERSPAPETDPAPKRKSPTARKARGFSQTKPKRRKS